MGSRQAWRKAWWQVHKWLGLALMILFVPLGLSGVVLAWDDAIDHALNPQRYAVHGAATLPPSAYAASAARALGPGGRIAQIRLPREGGPVTVMTVSAPRRAGDHGHDHGGRHAGGGRPARATLWLDPATARVMDRRDGDDGLVRLAHNFHGNLLVPGFGRALVGLLGIAMFLMAVGGIWLWWPPIGMWSRGLRWRRGDRRFDTNLHHQAGFWVALPLAAQAFTGIWMSWPQMMALTGLAPARGGAMERGRMVPAVDPHLTPDQALGDAQAAAPGKLVSIAWPVGDRGQWRVTLGKREMLVADDSGVVSPAPPRAGNGLMMAMRRYHDGTTLGTPWRVLMIALGLSPTLFAITGLTMWWRGRRWRRRAGNRSNVREPVAAV